MVQNNNCYSKLEKNYISQGDIIRNLNITFTSQVGNTEFQHRPSFSYGVILSQDCDLVQHYRLLEENSKKPEEDCKHDKILDVVLICPAYANEPFLQGIHISGSKMNDFNGPKGQQKAYEKLQNNDEYNRYHLLPAIPEVLPELIIDFKRFYTVPIELFEENMNKFYITSLKDLYKERLSQRFANYLSRIGFPDGARDDLINVGP